MYIFAFILNDSFFKKSSMHTNPFSFIQKQGVLYPMLLLIFVLQSINSQAQTTMITPPYLQKGDTVAIVATARKNIDDNLKPTIDLLHSWGLEVVVGSTIGLDLNQLAGTDDQRAADFQQQMDNQNIKAIWCARGGYGTVRMIDLLDFTKFKQHPKWIVGFSDVTVLHNHLNTMGYKSIHGTMPVSVERTAPESIESLKTALFGQKLSYQIDPFPMNRFGKATGELVGGNLSLLAHLVGTDSDIKTKGRILFIEDVGEYLYNIDRMIYQLKRSGKLDKLAGLIVGGFTDMKDTERPFGQTVHEIIRDAVAEYNYPVCFDFPVSHAKENFALKIGVGYKLKVGNNKVTLEE